MHFLKTLKSYDEKPTAKQCACNLVQQWIYGKESSSTKESSGSDIEEEPRTPTVAEYIFPEAKQGNLPKEDCINSFLQAERVYCINFPSLMHDCRCNFSN